MLRVLPELRRYGAARGIDIQFVDLRWGVTEAEIADGRLIERCLGVVDECRPFFIGILGRDRTTITRIPDALEPASRGLKSSKVDLLRNWKSNTA